MYSLRTIPVVQVWISLIHSIEKKAVCQLDFSLSDHPHGQYCPRIPLLHSPLCCTGYIGTIAIREQHSFSLRFILNYKLRTHCSQSTREGLFLIKNIPSKKTEAFTTEKRPAGSKINQKSFFISNDNQWVSILYLALQYRMNTISCRKEAMNTISCRREVMRRYISISRYCLISKQIII